MHPSTRFARVKLRNTGEAVLYERTHVQPRRWRLLVRLHCTRIRIRSASMPRHLPLRTGPRPPGSGRPRALPTPCRTCTALSPESIRQSGPRGGGCSGPTRGHSTGARAQLGTGVSSCDTPLQRSQRAPVHANTRLPCPVGHPGESHPSPTSQRQNQQRLLAVTCGPGVLCPSLSPACPCVCHASTPLLDVTVQTPPP